MLKSFHLYNGSLDALPDTSTGSARALLITTLNAHSYNVACKDAAFAEALKGSDVLLADGVSVVWAARLLRRVNSQQSRKRNVEILHQQSRVKSQESRAKSQESRVKTLKKIAGEDLFYWEMRRLQSTVNSQQSSDNRLQSSVISHQSSVNSQQANSPKRPKVFFLGSTEEVLAKIKERAGVEFPNVEVHTFSPPYKPEFTEEDNGAMYAAIHAVQPDVLFVGMTAPKQEKWAYALMKNEKWKIKNENETINYKLPTNCHVCCIGAVFDFYAGTVQRAPLWMIKLGLEWFYRLVKEPRRMWRRYLIGNVRFVWTILKEAVSS